MRRNQGGFTLIELMTAVAIISVLAAVAVAAYSRWVKKGKASEVAYVFGLFKVGQEGYSSENGSYLDCAAEGTYHPATLNGDSMVQFTPTPACWQQLRISPGKNGLYCGYNTVAGPANTAPPGAIGSSLWAGAAPTKNWFYVIARCDWNKDPGDYSIYTQRGDLTQMNIENEGK